MKRTRGKTVRYDEIINLKVTSRMLQKLSRYAEKRESSMANVLRAMIVEKIQCLETSDDFQTPHKAKAGDSIQEPPA